MQVLNSLKINFTFTRKDLNCIKKYQGIYKGIRVLREAKKEAMIVTS
jgi:hypothetical protein